MQGSGPGLATKATPKSVEIPQVGRGERERLLLRLSQQHALNIGRSTRDDLYEDPKKDTRAKPHIKIHSSRVILAEGTSEELIPGAEEAAGMHGLAIMVPPGESGEQLIEMMWRIAMVYAGLPSLLYSRSKVQKMVEAIMIRKSRKSPASKAAKGLRP